MTGFLDTARSENHDFMLGCLAAAGGLMAESKPQQTLQIKVSPELKKAIRRSALECDETVRTFILKALRTRGVPVPDEELVDHRKGVGR